MTYNEQEIFNMYKVEKMTIRHILKHLNIPYNGQRSKQIKNILHKMGIKCVNRNKNDYLLGKDCKKCYNSVNN